MFFYHLYDLAADFINPERAKLGHKPPQNLLADGSTGFIFGQKCRYYLAKRETHDGHILIIGGPGSGKSSCLAIPSVMAWRQRIFAIDIKGEIVKITGSHRPAAKVCNPLDHSTFGYDPFFLLSRSQNVVQDAREIVFAIIPRPPEIKDPFGVDGARNLLTGAVLHFFHHGYSFTETMIMTQSTPVAELIYQIGESESEDARLFVSQFTGMDLKTLVGIFAEISNHIIVFATDPAIKDCLTRKKIITPFDLEKGFDVFLQIPEDRLEQWKPLITLIVNQFMKHFERREEGESTPVLFLLDEFPRLGKVEAVNGLATLRSKKVTICLIAQSLAQLDGIYGRDSRKVIADNCSYKAILNATDAETQEYFSRLVGTYERARISHGKSFDGEDTDTVKGSSRNVTTEDRRVIKPEEFATLKDVVLLTPYGFCRAKKAPYYEN